MDHFRSKDSTIETRQSHRGTVLFVGKGFFRRMSIIKVSQSRISGSPRVLKVYTKLDVSKRTKEIAFWFS